ncbi:phosphoglucosamine mutase [bacterium]|nr:phosphoglucosamine mutase [bacterium]
MPFIASISGLRGTIGDEDGLNPKNIVNYILAYGELLKKKFSNEKISIVVGRDGRGSGESILNIVCSTLNFLGIDVFNIDLATTPTIELFVLHKKAHGAVIITASHNPNNWNGLKFLNELGEFLVKEDLEKMFSFLDKKDFSFAFEDDLGKTEKDETSLKVHVDKILSLDVIDKEKIREKKFKIAIDGINCFGGSAVKELLESLGVLDIVFLNSELGVDFAHTPEPLEKNLVELKETVKKERCDLGFAVDPDGDRLAIVCEDGSFFNEENTLVSVSKYILSKTEKDKRITVSNLSSTQGLRDITEELEGKYFPSAVGEVNVVSKMKEVSAVIGGEGNGGVIYPELHYGRDSLIGIALFLMLLSEEDKTCLEVKKELPEYFMLKEKISIDREKLPEIFSVLESEFKEENIEINKEDGLKIVWPKSWVHLRASNTEPIVRIYIEAINEEKAKEILKLIKNKIKNI